MPNLVIRNTSLEMLHRSIWQAEKDGYCRVGGIIKDEKNYYCQEMTKT